MATKPKTLSNYQKTQHTNVLTAAKSNLITVIDQVESLDERDYSDLKAYLATCVEMMDEELSAVK